MTTVIGITTKGSGVIGGDYLNAIRKSGGMPLIIPAEKGAGADLLCRIDGLLVTGGQDLHPSHYGEDPHPLLGSIDEKRDREELALIRWALTLDMPLLTICRGTQALNVACGGTLWQDIPSQMPTDIEHVQDQPKSKTTHKAYVRPDSLLHRITECADLRVNSFHHQAVKKLGEGLVVDAIAPDGLTEAISFPGKRFVLGTQWHPEGSYEIGEKSRAIFKAFVNAARG